MPQSARSLSEHYRPVTARSSEATSSAPQHCQPPLRGRSPGGRPAHTEQPKDDRPTRPPQASHHPGAAHRAALTHGKLERGRPPREPRKPRRAGNGRGRRRPRVPRRVAAGAKRPFSLPYRRQGEMAEPLPPPPSRPPSERPGRPPVPARGRHFATLLPQRLREARQLRTAPLYIPTAVGGARRALATGGAKGQTDAKLQAPPFPQGRG